MDGPRDLIFFYKALVVCSAFLLGVEYGCDRIAVYLDNTNTVDIFFSLCAKPPYNPILMSTIDFGINHSIVTKVYYIPGKQNVIANHLSRFQNVKDYNWLQNCKSAVFNPLEMCWGQLKNDHNCV
jgi:hypothetical protein